MKFVSMLFILPLADQSEKLQNFTLFCRTIIEVQEISGKVQFKAWKSPHLIWSPLFLVGMSEGLPFLSSEPLAPPAGSAAQFWEPEGKELEEVSRSNIEQF